MASNRWVIPLVLAVTVFVHYLDRNNLAIVLPQIAQEFGWSDQQTGQYGQYLLGAFYLTFGVAQIFLSPLAERFGVKRSLMLSILGFSVCTMLFYPLGGSLGALIALRLLLGAAESVHMPMNSALVSRWFAPHERGRANSIYVVGILVALAVAPLLIVPLAERFGWRMAFLLLGFAGLAISLPLVARFIHDTHPRGLGVPAQADPSRGLGVPAQADPASRGLGVPAQADPSRGLGVPAQADPASRGLGVPAQADPSRGLGVPAQADPAQHKGRDTHSALRQHGRDDRATGEAQAHGRDDRATSKLLWLYIAAGACNAFCVFGVLNWLPSYLNRTRGIQFGDLSLPLFSVFLAGIVGVLLWATLGDRTSKRVPMASAGLLLASVCVLLTAYAPSNAFAIALLALGVFSQSSFNAQEFATLQQIAHPARVGATTGLYNGTAVLVGGVGGSLIPGGIVALTGDFQMGLFSVAVGALMVSLLMAILNLRLPPQQVQ